MSGMINEMLKGMFGGQAPPPGVKPQIIGNELTIEIPEDQFNTMALEGANPAFRANARIEFHEKKMVIKVRLF